MIISTELEHVGDPILFTSLEGLRKKREGEKSEIVQYEEKKGPSLADGTI